jgi:hypothetical protein
MKKITLYLIACIAGVAMLAANTTGQHSQAGFVLGTPGIQSISALAFGPDGILFIGDSRSGTIFAIDTKDVAKADKAGAVEIKNIDQKIAALLGTQTSNITITDLVVNPLSRIAYVSIQSGDGSPALLKIEGDKISSVSLKDVLFSSIALNNLPAADAKDQRGNSLRVAAISDLGFADGKVLVSGLSNQEFSSTFRSINFPFNDKQDWASLEIYHAAHGRYETTSPIKTFTTATINGKKYLVASYTCTPLVLFPMDELKAGAHVKGRTVAEMGSGNQPIDMITLKKGDESFLVMSNSNRPVFKVKYKNIESFAGSLTTHVEENFATDGVSFVSMPVVSVLQMDKLDDGHMLMLQRKPNGDLDLYSSNDWLL